MEGATGKKTEKELTSTSTSSLVLGKLLSTTNKEEKNDSNDTVPTSSTDASTSIKSTHLVSDDIISSTSSEADSSKTKNMDAVDNAAATFEDELLGMSMKRPNEKIEENVDDLVNDLETLLGEASDTFALNRKTVEDRKEKTEVRSHDNLVNILEEKLDNEVSSNTETAQVAIPVAAGSENIEKSSYNKLQDPAVLLEAKTENQSPDIDQGNVKIIETTSSQDDVPLDSKKENLIESDAIEIIQPVQLESVAKPGQSLENEPAISADLEVSAEKCNISIEVDNKHLLSEKINKEHTKDEKKIGESDTKSEEINPTVEIPEKEGKETELMVNKNVEGTSGTVQENTEITECANEQNISKEVAQVTDIAEIKENDEGTNYKAETTTQIIREVETMDDSKDENIVSVQESTPEETLIEDNTATIQVSEENDISEASNEETIKPDVDQCIPITEQIESVADDSPKPGQSLKNKAQESTKSNICAKLEVSEEKSSISSFDNTELKEEAPEETSIEAPPTEGPSSQEVPEAPIEDIIVSDPYVNENKIVDEELPSIIIGNVVEEVAVAEVRVEKESATSEADSKNSEAAEKLTGENVIVQELGMAPEEISIVEKPEEITQENMPGKESQSPEEDVVEPQMAQENILVVKKSETPQEDILVEEPEQITPENVSVVEESDMSRKGTEESDLAQNKSEIISENIPLIEEPEGEVPLVGAPTRKVVEEPEITQKDVSLASEESELACVVEEISEENVKDSEMTEEYIPVVEEPEEFTPEIVSVRQEPETPQEHVHAVERSDTPQGDIPVIEEITENVSEVQDSQMSVEEVPVVEEPEEITEEGVSVVKEPEIAQEDLTIAEELKHAQEGITLVQENVPEVGNSEMTKEVLLVVEEPEKFTQKSVSNLAEVGNSDMSKEVLLVVEEPEKIIQTSVSNLKKYEAAQEDGPVVEQPDGISQDNMPVVVEFKMDQEEISEIALKHLPVVEGPEIAISKITQEDDSVVEKSETAHKDVSEVEKSTGNRSVIEEHIMLQENVPELEKSETAQNEVLEKPEGITPENLPVDKELEIIQEKVPVVEEHTGTSDMQESLPQLPEPENIQEDILVVQEPGIIQEQPDEKELVKLQGNVPITEMEQSEEIEMAPAIKQKSTILEKGESSKVIEEKQQLTDDPLETTKICEGEAIIGSLGEEKNKKVVEEAIKDNKIAEPVEEIKLVSEVIMRRKTVEQDLEKVVCLSEESSDSDISSLPKRTEDLPQYTEDIPQCMDESSLIRIAEEVNQFEDSEENMPQFEKIVSVPTEIVNSASNFETAMAVASLQNETVSESHVERRLSEKEIREMEAIRMAVASITDSSQDNSYDSYLVDNTMTVDSIQEFVSEDIENAKSADDIKISEVEICLAESTSVEVVPEPSKDKEICKEDSVASNETLGVIKPCPEDASEVEVPQVVASDSTQVDLIEDTNSANNLRKTNIDFGTEVVDKRLVDSKIEALVTSVVEPEVEQQHEEAASVATLPKNESSLEQVKEASVDEVGEASVKQVKGVNEIPIVQIEEDLVKKVGEAPLELVNKVSVELVNKAPVEKVTYFADQIKIGLVETVKEDPVGEVANASLEQVKFPVKQVEEAPVELVKKSSVKQVKDASIGLVKESSVKLVEESPVRQIKETPAEQLKKASQEFLEQFEEAPIHVEKTPVEQIEKPSVEQIDKSVEEKPKRSKRSKVIEPLSINVDEVDKKEKIYSPKITIKPIKAPDEEVSTTSADAEANKGSLKMTITKQSDKMHSILKVFDPEEEIEASQTQEESIRKSIYKPKMQQVEKQHSPKMSTRSTKVYSPTSTRSSSPRITKPLAKPLTEIKPDPHSPLKFTLKSVTKPEEVARKLSPKPIIDQEPKNHSPKIKIKPIPMPVEEEKEEVPKLNMKALKRHLEEDRTDLEQGRSSPKVPNKSVAKPKVESPAKLKKIKPLPSLLEKDQLLSVKTVEDEAEEGVKERIVLKINKGDLPSPVVENDQSFEAVEDEVEEVKKRIVLKINKGDLTAPVLENDELLSIETVEDEIEEEVKQRIVLKINKGSLPSPMKDSKKRNYAEEEKLEKAAIKMKFSTTGGTTHIIQDSEETSSKRQRTDSGYSAPCKFVEEVSQKRTLEEKVLEKNKRLKNSMDDKNEDSSDAVRIVETKLDSPIVISEDSRSQHSADCVIPDESVPDISRIANIASGTTHIAVAPVLTVGVATPITPSPKRRGRPRKAVLEVRQEFCPVEVSPSPSPSPTPIQSSTSSFSETVTPEATPSPGGRPKRSCRGLGQNVTAILGLKPRKPRGGGRGRGGKVNMGDRQPPAVAQASFPAPPVVEMPVETAPAKAEKEPKVKGKQKLTPKNAQEDPNRCDDDLAGQAVICLEEDIGSEGGTSPKKKKEDKTSARKLEVTPKRQKSQHQKVYEEGEKAPKPVESPTKIVEETVILISTDDESSGKEDSQVVKSKKSVSPAKPVNSPLKKSAEVLEEKIVEENKFKVDLLKYKQIEVVEEEEEEIVEEEDEDSGEESDTIKRKEWVLQRKQEAIKKCRAKRMEKLAKAAELKRKRQEQAAQQREARKAAEEAEKAASEKDRANKRYGRYGKPKPQISLIDAPVEETAGKIKSNLRLFHHPGSENIDDDDTGSSKQLESPQKSSAPEPMLIDSEDTPTKVRRSLGAEDIVMLDEETRMSADFRGSSRSQTPAKQAIAPLDIMVEDSQGSMGTEGGKSRSSKAPKMEVFQDLESLTAEQLAEYSWNSQGPFMIQEQVAQYLGIKSFKRKYPNITRRPVDMQERDYLKDCNLVTETQCDLGLTAVIAQDILDIMYTDFQDKFEDYCKCQRERQARELINKQKALNQFVLKPGFDKLDILEQAVQSAAAWNKQFNKARREQRKAHMDLQTLTVHYPKSKMKPAQTRKIGHYPVALVPGQFTDYYQDYTPTELNNLPINTMCYDEIKIGAYESCSDGSSSGSESDSDSTSGSSSDSIICEEEDCKDCVKKAKIENNDSDDVVIIENDASSSDSCVLVSVTAGHA